MRITKEEIAYDLSYLGEDEDLWRQIVEAIERLPEEVRDFALDRCRFLSVARTTHGMVLPGRIGTHEVTNEPTWLVLLSEAIPAEDVHGAIAHEIAHAWLGHDRLAFPPDDCEIQAANLTMEWGFSGVGADAEHCHV